MTRPYQVLVVPGVGVINTIRRTGRNETFDIFVAICLPLPMVGGLARGSEVAGAARHPAFYIKQVITVAFIALIVLMLRVSGVGGTGFAGELAFGLAALIPAAAMRRPSAAFRQAAFEELPVSVMAPEMAAS